MSDNPKPDTAHDWVLSPTGKWYYYESPGLRIYASGTKYQEGKGIIASPRAALITVDNAKAMQEAGLETRQRNVIEGYKRAIANKRKVNASEIGSDFVQQAYSEAVMEHALDKYAPGSANVKRLAAELLGWLPDKRGVRVEDNAGNSLQAGSVDELRELIVLVRGKIAAVTGGMAQDAPADVPALPEARRPISQAQDVEG